MRSTISAKIITFSVTSVYGSKACDGKAGLDPIERDKFGKKKQNCYRLRLDFAASGKQFATFIHVSVQAVPFFEASHYLSLFPLNSGFMF